MPKVIINSSMNNNHKEWWSAFAPFCKDPFRQILKGDMGIIPADRIWDFFLVKTALRKALEKKAQGKSI